MYTCGKLATAKAVATPARDSSSKPSMRLLSLLFIWYKSPTAWLVACSCEPLIASVLSLLIKPAATFCTRRSSPSAPTVTTPAGLPPANAYSLPPMVALSYCVVPAVCLLASVVATEPEPKFTEFSAVLVTLLPNTKLSSVAKVLLLPILYELSPSMILGSPMAPE